MHLTCSDGVESSTSIRVYADTSREQYAKWRRPWGNTAEQGSRASEGVMKQAHTPSIFPNLPIFVLAPGMLGGAPSPIHSASSRRIVDAHGRGQSGAL